MSNKYEIMWKWKPLKYGQHKNRNKKRKTFTEKNRWSPGKRHK